MLCVVDYGVGNLYSLCSSLAAVGATGALISLIINLFVGLSVGAGITVARAIGSGDRERAEKAIHTAIPIALIGSVILTAIGVPLSSTFLKWMGTPDTVIELSTSYLQIYFSGTVFILLYNFGSAILRATGDTARPLFYLIAAGFANVIFNVFFVTVFHMDVAGVALATTISNAISAILVLFNLIKRTDSCRLEIKKLQIDAKALKSILHIGLPAGITSSIFSISNVLIQSSINSFGDLAMSGAAAGASIDGFIYISMNSFSHTAQNFVSQNYGAKKFDRIKKTVLTSSVIVTFVGILLGLGAYLLSHPLLSIYIKDSEEAIAYGVTRLKIIGCMYFICGIVETFSGAIRGLGSSLPPTIISFFGVCMFRVFWVYLIFPMEKFHSLEGIYVSYPISWLALLIAYAITFAILFKRRKREHEKIKITN